MHWFPSILVGLVSAIVSSGVIYLTISVFYLVFLAAIGLFKKSPVIKPSALLNRFCILIPAHNEELLLGHLLESLNRLSYQKDAYDVVVIADNCSDGTVSVARMANVNILERNDSNLQGKGFAISWALKKIELGDYQALVIIDADSIADVSLLSELNHFINNGSSVIQCYNGVANPEGSWFTGILSVSRNLENILYHHAKYKLGLSSHLMGNGMCFTIDVLTRFAWEAFSSGEDWEYYANLVEHGEKVCFAVNAKVFHQESRSLSQATPQRLRWSGGRFAIAKKYGLGILFKGLKTRNWKMVDASLPLLLPNYSLQMNLTLVLLLFTYLTPILVARNFFVSWLLFLAFLQGSYFSLGMYISKPSLRTIISVALAPAFLIWKLAIDVLGIIGKGTKRWVRTERHLGGQPEKAEKVERKK
jgi:cellulose synthase/poly-beta-1,6-N-acetylglucosamine synthase-like glycosyltransferase